MWENLQSIQLHRPWNPIEIFVDSKMFRPMPVGARRAVKLIHGCTAIGQTIPSWKWIKYQIVNSESKSIRRRDDDVVIAVCVHGK